MTTVAFMSDLHIDSNNFGEEELETLITLLKDQQVQHLHIAGDIANGFGKTSQKFLAQLQCHLPVSFSLGNHDMLGLSEEAMRPFEFQKIPFSKHTLLAFSGWYDYSFVPDISPQKHLQTKNLFWFDRRLQRMGSDPAITKNLLQELEQELMRVNQPLIIAMHFVPHSQFLLRHPYFECFNAFLGSQAFHELFRQFFEDFPEFDFSKRYDPYKRYRRIKDLPEFKAYKKKKLKHEFSQAMIILKL